MLLIITLTCYVSIQDFSDMRSKDLILVDIRVLMH